MYESVSYEKSFLSQAIARIDFVAAVEALQKSLPTRLAKIISDYFPIVEPTEALEQEFHLQTGQIVNQRQTTFKQWNFYGKEREKQLSIAPSFVFISYTRYTTYEDMKADFSAVTTAIEGAVPDIRAGRFGLRYINNIEIEGVLPAMKWDEYISPTLLGMTAFSTRAQHLTRLFHVVELKYEDLNIRFQFGMPNPDYPAVIKRPLFVLDLDGYVQSAHDFKQSIQYIDEAHKHIQDLFETSITDRLRERMRARPKVAIQ